MLEFAHRPTGDLHDIFNRVGAQRTIPPHIIEKDFWVCWLLRLIFADPELGGHLVFKGGTSLSKVFGIIQRFSEDIDLSVDPGLAGVQRRRASGRRVQPVRSHVTSRLYTVPGCG
jgi:predicted nucleotidyltransferase component of viral defense system